jgi:Uma2 family endonuclease
MKAETRAGRSLYVAVQPKRHFTPEEYLDLEIDAPYRSEYINGEIYAMSGASEEHAIIAGNIYASLRPELRGGPCRMFMNDMRVKVEATELYTYPDIIVVCGEREYEVARRGMSLLNPILLVEVLSESTELYDRGAKFQHYRKIPALREYLLVAQEEQRIERYLRNDDGDWIFSEAVGPDGVMTLASIGATLRLSEVYADITFDPVPPTEIRSALPPEDNDRPS